MRRFIVSAFVLTNVLFFSTSCSKSTVEARVPRIVYGYSPPLEEAAKGLQRTDLLSKYLQRKTGIRVDVVQTEAYGPMVEAMCAGKVDAAGMGPFAYVIASNKGCAEILAVRGTQNGDPSTYKSVIATNGASGIKSLADLKARSHELTFAFNDPASTSGHLVPRAELESIGIKPERDFKKVMFTTNHVVTALTVKAGKVDAAGMMARVIDILVAHGKLKQGELRVLWTSEPLPSEPIAVRPGLPADIKTKLQKAFFDLNKEDPALMAMLNATVMAKDARYVAGSDKLFDPIREIAHHVPQMQLLDK
jgi:phosphonate transport system substrate-binding protein